MLLKLWTAVDGRKTYIVAAVTILYAVVIVGWQGHQWQQASELILGALGLSSLRNSIS